MQNCNRLGTSVTPSNIITCIIGVTEEKWKEVENLP